jgi:hypothetical protein
MYEYAAAEEAEEITVEDPNPHFRVLRDAVDLRNCLRLGLMRPAPGKPSTDTYKAGAAALRITDEQLLRCYEAQQYALLQPQLAAAASDAEREALAKPWRLDVKRRLNKKHREELDAIMMQVQQAEAEAAEAEGGGAGSSAGGGAPPAESAAGKEARKKKLDELYCEVEAEYTLLLRKVA